MSSGSFLFMPSNNHLPDTAWGDFWAASLRGSDTHPASGWCCLLKVSRAITAQGNFFHAGQVKVLPVYLIAFVVNGNQLPTLGAAVDVDLVGRSV